MPISAGSMSEARFDCQESLLTTQLLLREAAQGELGRQLLVLSLHGHRIFVLSSLRT
jgi:hypothetical protein